MSSNDNSLARTGSNYSTKSGAAAVRSNNLARMATENSAAALMGKPKLIRQTAILADGDSTGSGKSVTFQVYTLAKSMVWTLTEIIYPNSSKLVQTHPNLSKTVKAGQDKLNPIPINFIQSP